MSSDSNPILPRSGIRRRLLRVMLLQMLFISIITILGVFVAAKVVEGVMMRAALEGEAEHFWTQLSENQSHPLPNTDNLLGYLSFDHNVTTVPSYLHEVESGFGRVKFGEKDVLVLMQEEKISGRPATLYLVFDEESVAKLSFYFGVVPLSLVLILIYLAGWYGFKQTSKAVSPVIKLASELHDFNPEQMSTVALNLDILKTKHAEDEINILVDSLNAFTNEINQLIDRERRFTRDASHELRTPVAVIQGSVEFLLENTELNTVQVKSLNRMLRTSKDMNELVTALLILARGKGEMPEMTDVSINDVVTEQLDQLQLSHNADNHVIVKLNHRSDIRVCATEQFVKAVVNNLLRNAFNYTREGEVEIVIAENTLEISNRGKGVRPQNTSEIFKPFVRGDNHQQNDGHGVGLDIVNRLCELFRWTVISEYSEEKGMIFRITF